MNWPLINQIPSSVNLKASVAVAVLIVVTFLKPVTLFGEKFSPEGKRDPFVRVKAEQVHEFNPPSPPPLSQRPPGLAGLLISEVAVAGTAANRSRNLVILKGVDKVSYIAGPGTKLFNGFLEKITPTEVVFIREELTKTGKEPRRVVKGIYTEDR